MDEFGVLTEHYGIKPQGKSAPMASSKRPPNNPQSWKNLGGVNPKSTSYSSNKVSGNESDHVFFTSSSANRNGPSSSGGFDDFDDVFAGLNKPNNTKSSSSLSDDLMFSTNFGSSSGMKTSSSAQGFDDADLFGAVMPASKSSVNDDIFGSSFSSSAKQDASGVDDLLGDMGGFGLQSKTWNQTSSAKNGFDELIPGFGGSSQTTTSKTAASNFVVDDDDPFVILESTTSTSHSSSGLFVDPLDEFAASVSKTSHASTKLRPPPKPTQKVDRG